MISQSHSAGIRQRRTSRRTTGDFSRTKQAETLKSWQNRHVDRLGEMVSPTLPEDLSSHRVANNSTRQAVEQVLAELLQARADLSTQDRFPSLAVELFSGNVPYAEASSWAKSPYDPNLVPKLHKKRSTNQKPLYLLLMSKGMLDSLKTRDELAFVVARQLAEIEELHTKGTSFLGQSRPMANSRSFVQSDTFNSEADLAAVNWMEKAGFNPKAALTALQSIYQNTALEPIPKDFQRAKSAVKADFEAEGIRFTTMQSRLYEMEAVGSEALQRPQQPLPQDFQLQTAPLSLDEEQGSTTLRVRDLTLRFLNSEPPTWFHNLDSHGAAKAKGRGTDRKLASEQRKLQFGRYSDLDRESNLAEALSYMEDWPPSDPKPSLGSLLQLFTILDKALLPQGDDFSPTLNARLNKLTEQMEWDPSSFLDSLGQNTSTRRRFAETVLLNSGFQNTLGEKTPELYQALPELWIAPGEDGKTRWDELPSLVTHVATGFQNTELRDHVKAGLLKLVGSIGTDTHQAQITGTSVIDFSHSLLQSSINDEEFYNEMLAATSELRHGAQELVTAESRTLLIEPFPSTKKIHDFLREAGTLEMTTPLKSEAEMESRQLLEQSSLTLAEQGLIFADGSPQMLPPPLEARLTDLATSATGEDQNHLLDHLFRHFDNASDLREGSDREERLSKTAEILADPTSGSLHSEFEDSKNLFSETLQNSLKAIFPEENFDADSADDLEKLKDIRLDTKAKTKLAEVEADLAFLASAEPRPLLGRLAVLGHFRECREKAAGALQREDFKTLLATTEEAIQRSSTLQELIQHKELAVNPDVSAFLVEGFLANFADEQDTTEFLETLKRCLSVSKVKGPGGILFHPVGSTFEPALSEKLSRSVFQHLDRLEEKELPRFLDPALMKLLKDEAASSLLLKLPLRDQDTEGLAHQFKHINKRYELSEKHPEIFRSYRARFAEKYAIQASNLEQVFGSVDEAPAKKESLTAIMSLSGLVSLSREKSPEEQLSTIDYILGRTDVMPSYLANATQQPFLDETLLIAKTMRSRLAKADHQTRALAANSFLAGPSGMLETKQQRDVVIEHFLGSIESKHRDLARKVAEALLRSHGESDTLIVANLLAHGSDPVSGKTDLADLLNQLFDSFGVPGTKMKQYLAFTSEFEEFRDAFQSSQDAADPLDHYQALKLVENRFGSQWPANYQVEKILGSGSINVALRYQDNESEQIGVVALARSDIEARTNQDFKRFRAFLDELIKTPEDRKKFGYVLGLVELVEQSVALEFDKEAALAVQKEAFQVYQHQVSGWDVRSIDAFEAENGGLFMDEAKGIGARKLRQRDQALYNEAMGALVEAEFGVLRGETSKGNHKPAELFANPDIHDGQVLIDQDNKAVTILDFGQATPITNEEREGALDLLTVIVNADSPKKAARRMNRRYFGGEEILTTEDLESILQRDDRMDRFIHLLSAINLASGDVPISSVHWVFGMNRQVALSETVGKPIEKAVGRMVRNHKLGLPLSWFNRFN